MCKFALLCFCFILPASGAVVNLTPASDLQSVFDTVKDGDIISLSPGTYTVKTGAPYFNIIKAVTVQSTGPGVILQAPTNALFGLAIRVGGVTVSNLTVNGGSFGVSAAGDGGVPITGATLTGLTINPLLSAGHAIQLIKVAGPVVSNCTVGTGFVHGVYVSASNNVQITNTTIAGAQTQDGLVIQASTGIVVNNVSIGTAAVAGVLIQDSPGAALTAVSVASVTGSGSGVVLDNSPGVSMNGVTVTNTGTSGNGILISNGSHNVTSTGNGLTVTSAGVGVQIYNSSGANLANVTVGSTKSGAGILLSTAPKTTINGATITSAFAAGVAVNTSDLANITGVTVKSGASGIAVSGSNDVTLTNIAVNATTVDGGISFTTSLRGVINGATLSSIGKGVLIQAGSDNFKSQGAGITVNTASTGIYVLNSANVALSKVTVMSTTFDDAIFLSNSPNPVLDNITVNAALKVGINIVTGSTLAKVNGPAIYINNAGIGIVVQNVGGATITRANIGSTTLTDGILLDNSPNSTIDSATIANAKAIGINVINGSTNARLISPAITTAAKGIVVQNSSGASVTGASVGTITGKDGILFDASPNGVIASPTVLSAAANGIFIYNGSAGASISGATISSAQIGIAVQNSGNCSIVNSTVANATLNDGILLQTSPNCVLDGNTVTLAASNGIFVTTGSNHPIVRKNTVMQAVNKHGIAIQGSNAAQLFQNTSLLTPNGHGIVLDNSSNGILDSNVVNNGAPFCGLSSGLICPNAIFLDNGSNGNVVINNTVARARGHAMAVKNSNLNVVSGNLILSSGFHGIEVIGGSFNRLEKNNISGHLSDGIVLTLGDDAAHNKSLSNYVAKNIIVSNGAISGRTSGTGIWNDYMSNNSFIFGNLESGSVEAGITTFNSNNAYVKGNVASGNGQAGILLWNQATEALGSDPVFYPIPAPRPQYQVIQNNYLYDNPANGQILIRGAYYNTIGKNAMHRRTSGAGGLIIASWNEGSFNSGGSTGNDVYLNSVVGLQTAMLFGPDTQQTNVYENRFINSPDTYSYTGSGVAWDAANYMGGNYYNGSLSAPYTNFIYDVAGHRGGGYADRYPQVDEALGRGFSLVVTQPVAGQIAAAGSQKTIAWKSTGCYFADISYNSAATGTVSIASNWGDSGFYHWTLPAGLPAGTYTIKVDCKTSSQSGTGVTSTSSGFTVGTSDLVLLSPGMDYMANGGVALRVAWRRSSSVAAVNVMLVNNGVSTTVASNVNANWVDVLLPITASNRAVIALQATNNASMQDAVDGYFTIRSGPGKFTNPSAASTDLLIRDVVDLEWISPPGSQLVTLEFYDTELSSMHTIVKNLPDYSKYSWHVPENWMTGGYIRATFMDANGVMLAANGTAVSGANNVNLRYTISTGSLVSWYRLYFGTTQEHFYTSDLNEYNVLGGRGWSQEGPVGKLLNGYVTLNGVNAAPYYRVYDTTVRAHLWTADRNEYFTLRQAPNYTAEHIVGYVFRTQTGSTVPFYRLVYTPGPYYHLWTSDQNEYSVLQPVWHTEGVSAYLWPKSAATPADASSSAPMLVSAAAASSSKTGGKLATSGLKAAPVLKAVLNGASYLEGPIAPGEAVSLFGAALGPEKLLARESAALLTHELGGTRVLFDGIAGDIVFASDGEVKTVAPFELAGRTQARVTVERHGSASNSLLLEIAESAPALFTADSTGQGQASVLNQDRTLNSDRNPAARGAKVNLLMTGTGRLTPLSVEIGGIATKVLEAVAVEGVPGAWRITVIIPDSVDTGAVPVTVRAGRLASQPNVTLAVR